MISYTESGGEWGQDTRRGFVFLNFGAKLNRIYKMVTLPAQNVSHSELL